MTCVPWLSRFGLGRLPGDINFRVFGRRISIPLDFLPEGRFEAEICEDGADAHYLHHRESLQSRTATLSAGEPLQVQLAPGGGCCVLIRKASSQPE